MKTLCVLLSCAFALALAAIAMPQLSNSAAQGPTSNVKDWLEYSRCIRANGYEKFPDPDSNGFMRLNVDPQDRGRFEAAQLACKDKLPGGTSARDRPMTPERMQALLGFAQCMRGKGVSGFPDPSSQGVFEIGDAVPDVLTPQMGEAMQSCSAEYPHAGISIRRAKP